MALSFTGVNSKNILWWLLVLLALMISIYLWRSENLSVQGIDCTYVDGGACDVLVFKELEQYMHTRLWLVQPDVITTRLETVMPSDAVQHVSVDWDQSRLMVRLEPIAPVIYLAGSSSGPAYGLSDQARVVTFAQTLEAVSVPVVLMGSLDPLQVGVVPEGTLYKFLVELALALNANSVEVREIRVLSGEEIILSVGDRSGIVRSSKSATSQVRALQLILATATIEPSLRIVDVRFDQPVIKPYR